MKTAHLVNCLRDIVMNAETPAQVCRPEDGIRFMSPPPNAPVPGIVFAGTLSEWRMLCENNFVYPQCTYLVCTNGEASLPVPPENSECNILILNASVKTTLHKLTGLLMRKSVFSDTEQSALYTDFWHSVMDGALEGREQVTQSLRQLPYPMHAHVACIVVTSDTPDLDPLQIQDVQSALRSFFPETNLFRYNKEWIVLYSQEKDTSVELDISYPDFSRMLDRYNLCAGISYACQLPERYRTMYLTASASVKLGKTLKMEPYLKRIYSYYQYNPYYLIRLAAQKFKEIHNTDNIVYLAHPDVIRLYYYDLENKNTLLDVLEAYLTNAQNLTLTAKALYMHRNTVSNKLNKIEEVLGHKPFDEKDHFLILLSCMIVKYLRSRKEITEFFPL